MRSKKKRDQYQEIAKILNKTRAPEYDLMKGFDYDEFFKSNGLNQSFSRSHEITRVQSLPFMLVC